MNKFQIDELMKAINIILAKSRRYFSEEDIDYLNQCLEKLDQIKLAIQIGENKDEICSRFVEVVKNLDAFFGVGDYINRLYDLP